MQLPAAIAPPVRPPVPGDTSGTRAWTLWSPEGWVDVEVDAADGNTVADVLAGLSTALGVPVPALWAGTSPLPQDTPLSAPALRHGAVLGVGCPGPRGVNGAAEVGGSGALELHVVSGPDSGRTAPLGQGDLVLGRGASCGLPLADPDVSRRHAMVSVGAGQVRVADLGSSNGSLLRTSTGTVALGAHPLPWPVGATLHAGASAIRLTGPRGAPLDCGSPVHGRLPIRPLPSPMSSANQVTVAVPAAPPEASRRRLGWVALVVPAAGGLLMAWLLKTPQFLFFALLSPVVAMGNWLSDRLSGRRSQRRAVASHATALVRSEQQLAAALSAALAAADDAHPDPAQLAAAARRRSSPLWSRDRRSPDLLVVRLGTGPGPTSVTRVEPDGSRTTVAADHLPVTLDLGVSGGIGVVGPRGPVMGMVRALLTQLTALVPPGDLRVVVVTVAGRTADWRWARWLPHLTAVIHPPGQAAGPAGGVHDGDEVDDGLLGALADVGVAASREAAAGDAGPQRGARSGPVTLVVLDAAVRQETAATLATAQGVVCLALAGSAAGLPVAAAACLTVIGETGARGRLRLGTPAPDRELALDAVPEAVAAATARSLAGLAPPAAAGGLPDTARLLDVPGGGLRIDAVTGAAMGRWSRGRNALTCSLGYSAAGPLALDLCAQGPHLLVAGTTGSGKSELLQTLVASLALHQPPDRVSFLLVDYKGGAAFAEAAGLPHTVGVLTDLDNQSTVRALRSLAAELTRRERLLAQHGVRDLSELPCAVPAARLVIVVDEFATLAEELPGFVSGLVGIAQRGRSLGVHLVLATQRPSGVVSPEIRANCSLRICLRTTDESDSRDVLGSPLAATLPVGRPGRAYLRTGSSAPVLLQVARVAGAAARTAAEVTVRRRPWPPPAELHDRSAPDGQRPGDLAELVGALRRRAEEGLLTPPGRPWLPPLPDRLPVEELDAGASPDEPGTVLRVGLLDSPDTQSQRPLLLDLASGGGWLTVGGPRSGRTTALRMVLGEAVHQLSPAALHVHVLDHGGGTLAAQAELLPHTGTAVGRDDAHRTVRLLARLQQEVDRRRAGGPVGGPALLLLVDGYESLAAQLDDADPGAGSTILLRLVREGAAAGLTCVLTAERAVPGSRLAAAMTTRLVLPLPDRADYAVAGIAARAVPGSRPPGRALVGEDAAECQLALPRAVVCPAGDRDREPLAGSERRPPAVRVVTLPPDPELDLPEAAAPAGPLWLPVGPGDDEGGTVGLDLVRSGGLLVVGPSGSGRTTALHAFAQHCRHAGVPVLEVTRSAATTAPGAGTATPGDDLAGLREWAARWAGRPAVVVADDVGALPDPVADALAGLIRPQGDLIVLAAASAAELAGAFRGPTVALRRSRTVLLLRPAAGDGELLGIRVPRTPLPLRPGSGWLVVGGAATRVQVARRRANADQADQA